MSSKYYPKNIARFVLRCLTASALLLILLTAILLGPPSSLGQTSKGISKTSSEKASGGPRTALVIGNAKYTSAPLRNPVNDARAISSTLQELGFQVTLLEDAGQKKMKRAINRFGKTLRDGGVGLFYFSGHGMQVEGSNYLIPVDAEVDAEADVEYEAVEAGRVLAKMKTANNGMNLVILDACRNNPFARSFRSASKGLATLNAPSGTFIAYATSPGSVASDGTGDNGLYTGELVRHMKAPGLKIEEVFKRVRSGVQVKSENKQVPWDASSLTGDFFFVPPQEQLEQQVAKVALPQPSSSEAPKTIRADEEAWKLVKGSQDAEDFRFFLEEYPDSSLAGAARIKLRRLQRGQAAAETEAARPAEEKPPPSTVTFVKSFGGKHADRGLSVLQTGDGEYVVAGGTRSYGRVGVEEDAWLIRTDSTGNEVWWKTYGGAKPDVATSVAQTADGGFILCGVTQSYASGGTDVWLLKTDSSGEESWSKTFGGNSNDYGYSVALTFDGYLITAGLASTNIQPSTLGGSDVWLIKTDDYGRMDWSRNFGTWKYEIGLNGIQTADGGFAVTGFARSRHNTKWQEDVWLIRTDSGGILKWERKYGGSAEDKGYSVRQTTDGGFVVAGLTRSYGRGGQDGWLIKTDSKGNEEWNRTFGWEGNDAFSSVRQTTDGGFVLTGSQASHERNGTDLWLLKTDSLGNEQWGRIYGDGGGHSYRGGSVMQTADHGYIIAGQSDSWQSPHADLLLIKTDSSGSIRSVESR